MSYILYFNTVNNMMLIMSLKIIRADSFINKRTQLKFISYIIIK